MLMIGAWFAELLKTSFVAAVTCGPDIAERHCIFPWQSFDDSIGDFAEADWLLETYLFV
jgi:hypothetical protein